MRRLLFPFILVLFFSGHLYAQEEMDPQNSLIEDEVDLTQDKEGLWLELSQFNFFDENMNELIKKRVMFASTKQTDYRLILPDARVTEEKQKFKKSTKKVSLNITKQGEDAYKIEAQLIDQKDKSIIRRVTRSFVSEIEVLAIVEKATLLLFFDNLPDNNKDENKDKIVKEKLKDNNALDKATIDFRQEVKSLKNEISAKFAQIKQEELKKELEKSKDQDKEDKENDNSANQGMNMAQVLNQEQNAAQEPPPIVAPRNRILTQFGIMSQNYLIQENASTINEIEIRTSVQFVYLQAETMRQLIKGTQLDWVAGLKFSHPLSKAEVPLKKYTNLKLGLHYGLFANSSFPIGISAFVIKDNLSFANVPVAGQGLKTSDLSTMWSGARFAVGAWEKKLALWFSYHSLMSFSAEEGTFGNQSMAATRMELSLLYDTGWILKNTLASLNYQSLSFTSEGTRQVDGTNTSLIISLGYLF